MIIAYVERVIRTLIHFLAVLCPTAKCSAFKTKTVMDRSKLKITLVNNLESRSAVSVLVIAALVLFE